MNKLIFDLFEKMQFAEKLSYKNITLKPFLFRNGNKLKYICIDDALNNNYIEIKEVSEGGSVPELFFVNNSDERVLLLDGEELIGAKQNRVLNATILVDKRVKTNIPVSCVEQSRWKYKESKFSSSGNSMPSFSKSSKMRFISQSLKIDDRMEFRANQSQVWDDVERVSRATGTKSSTDALSDVFEKKSDDIQEYIDNLKYQNGNNGFFIFINEMPAGIEYISNEDVYSKLYTKILKGYIMDAILDVKIAKGADLDVIKDEYINKLKVGQFNSYKSIGLGDDHRFDSDNITASALIVEDEIVHFSALNVEQKQSSYKTSSVIRRLSAL